MKKEDLYNWYNATSTDDPPGSDELETYESWLERQLISRIEKVEVMRDLLTGVHDSFKDEKNFTGTNRQIDSLNDVAEYLNNKTT